MPRSHDILNEHDNDDDTDDESTDPHQMNGREEEDDGSERGDEEDGGMDTGEESSTDEIVRPLTRSKTGPKHSSSSTSTDLADGSIEDQIVALAHDLRLLESPVDLRLLYPPQFCSPLNSGVRSTPEVDVLDEFIAMEDQFPETHQEREFLEFELDDFCVYRAPGHPQGFEGQYENLVTVTAERHQHHWLVDGVLKHNGTGRRIHGGQIIDVSIGGLEDMDEHTTENSIWIMTLEGGDKGYWYRLRSPSQPYSRYWSDFHWLADLCKYFLDYLHHNREGGVVLSDLRTKFWMWLQDAHGNWVNQWQSKCGFREDFRKDVLRHAQFLRNQAHSLCRDQDRTRLEHPIWSEIGAGQYSHDQQSSSEAERTVVTANVAHSFLKTFPRWQSQFKLLEIVEMSLEVHASREKRIRDWGFPDKFRYDQTKHFLGPEGIAKAACLLEDIAQTHQPVRIQCLEDVLRRVIVVKEDSPGNDVDVHLSYAWVRTVSMSKKSVGVVWLVLLGDTICGSREEGTFYPIGNELFFSDRCNCQEVAFRHIVTAINASVFTDHAEEGVDLFVHGLCREEGPVFVKAVESELACQCRANQKEKDTKATPPRATRSTGRQKLHVLSLFSGCGLLDHGFVAPGFAETVFAIEHCEIAMRSYQANDETKKTRCEIGSVNEWLRRCMTGEEAWINGDCLLAGSPCKGFSNLNVHKDKKKGQKNCSLLANTLSWVEVFLPAYVVIENVPNMDKMRPNACAQAISHLVALGYQVRKMLCNVSRLGGASGRQRLIILAAAPGAVLPDGIPETHGGPGSGLRRMRTSSEAMGDLAPLHNDTVVNLRDPDHIPLERLKVDVARGINLRSVMQQIPAQPPGMSLARTYQQGGLLPAQRDWFATLPAFKQRGQSRCLRRVDATRPFRTICTVISPMDAKFSGEIMHPSQARTLSLREACRAMDLPDRFLLAGTVREQFRMIGNGVPWSLAASLGRAVGRCWIDALEKRAEERKEGEGEGDAAEDRVGVKKEDAEAEDASLAGGERSARVAGVPAGATPKRRGRTTTVSEDSDSSVEFLEARPVKKARPERE